MIKSFANKRTLEFFNWGRCRKLPFSLHERASRKLDYLNSATSIEDLRVPPGNKLHALSGDRVGQHAISVNDQWRICFRFENGDAYDVEICDYHK
ncbi:MULTISPECIES: type II toxin-antitoxin system RelE/ParE family toxin [Gammaproteobacteria]|uniref:type II toxin-antitoxin system RelE/ParE family toxin n=1 Tax=Gammaproteobacteria TaxID=1236 RepID=UPI000DD0DACE|nr:type II toxin-antitoxin system RelE/ParE family toxin [Lysobacter sp. N42]RTE87416.1 type II toxin-antitoxin system RelE/ParE family toxin [Aliidiomarina sp. B3213]TCZ92799.1 type II toxin-antitoxin system RelE/ParE family toxin [Lysobacter sp. N42]